MRRSSVERRSIEPEFDNPKGLPLIYGIIEAEVLLQRPLRVETGHRQGV